MSLPCGPCGSVQLPSGPSSLPPGFGFFRFLLVLEVVLSRHFLVVLAPARHFLLVLRHSILASRRAPARASPQLTVSAFPSSPILVLRLLRVSHFSSHPAVACHRQQICILTWKRLPPPWALAGLRGSSPTRLRPVYSLCLTGIPLILIFEPPSMGIPFPSLRPNCVSCVMQQEAACA